MRKEGEKGGGTPPYIDFPQKRQDHTCRPKMMFIALEYYRRACGEAYGSEL